jgi:hypothetical protein
MTEMKPLTKVAPNEEITPHREPCNKAFALACGYSRGHDLMEEMVAARFWPLEKSRPSFKIEMVNLPVYGEADGVPFPYFGIVLWRRRLLRILLLSWNRRHGKLLVI